MWQDSKFAVALLLGRFCHHRKKEKEKCLSVMAVCLSQEIKAELNRDHIFCRDNPFYSHTISASSLIAGDDRSMNRTTIIIFAVLSLQWKYNEGLEECWYCIFGLSCPVLEESWCQIPWFPQRIAKGCNSTHSLTECRHWPEIQRVCSSSGLHTLCSFSAPV